MNVMFSIDDEVLILVRRRAEAMGSSVNQLLSDYLEQLAGKSSAVEAADEFIPLSGLSEGNSNGWKFERDELHDCR
jgi:hypothetical protein